MNAKEAVANRILDLANDKDITINGLAYRAGISPSTIYSMLNQKSKNPGVVSLQRICEGLGISLRDFFNCDIFDNVEQELD